MDVLDISRRWTGAGNWLFSLLGIGFFWLFVGVAATPGDHSSSYYHWLVTVLLLVPAVWVVVRERRWLARQWLAVPELRFSALLLLWAIVSLFWAQGTHPVERIKIPLQISLFLCAWLFWVNARGEKATVALLFCSGLGLALSALVAMTMFHWRDMYWVEVNRMVGFNMLDGPNLSGYVMGAAAVWMFQLVPETVRGRVLWAAAIAILLVFVAWTFSRGAWLALFACMLLMPVWDRSRKGWASAAVAVVGAAVVAERASSFVDARGASYRPEIFHQSLQRIVDHPLRGLGMDTPYTITVVDQSWTHSHNLFTNLAIELGLPGLVFWLVAWVCVLIHGWKHRHRALGRIVIGIWVFATVALQLDGPSLVLSPRPEWLLTWLPLAIAAGLSIRVSAD
jgi:O-antigen ligase